MVGLPIGTSEVGDGSGEGSGEGSGAVVGSGEDSTVGSGEDAGLGSAEGLGSGLGDSVAGASVVGSAGESSANAVGPVRVIRTARTTDIAIGLRIRCESRRYRRPNAHASLRCVPDPGEAESLRRIHPFLSVEPVGAPSSEEPPVGAPDRYPILPRLL